MKISFINSSMEGYGADASTKAYYKYFQNKGVDVFYNRIDSGVDFYIISMYSGMQKKRMEKYLRPKKYVYIERSIECILPEKDFIREWIMPNSKKNFFLSPRHNEHIKAAFPKTHKNLAKDNIDYLVVPVDKELFQRNELIERVTNLNLFVGFIHSNKGVLNILKIAKKNPEQKFWFIGNGGGDIDTKTFLNGYENCKYIGHVNKNKLPDYYSKAQNLYILPTNGAIESASRVVFEAVLCGCNPIVNHDVGNASYEWYKDKEKIIKNIEESNQKLFDIVMEG